MNFGSAWKILPNQDSINENTTYSFIIPGYPINVTQPNIYVFGVDPVWKGSSNELLYYNSVKMKMSIIIGIIQMSLGIFLHFFNALHFKHNMDIFGEFIPRIVFLWAIFGYLCFMIFFKWSTNYPEQNVLNIQWKVENNITGDIRGPYPGTSDAPVLLNELIFMVLPGGKPDNLYKGQHLFQYALVAIAVLMVPIMCCLKPCHYKHFVKPKIPKHLKTEENTDQIDSEYQLYHPPPEEQEEFSELMVHQLLETIEFVLGSVSHTASYLRLWALSLAHSELATVFWNKVVFLLIDYTVGVNWFVVALGTFAAFSIWFFITFLVMLFMEGLSAFLHALRLHWVEFQSKFYKGDGHEFQPFSYSQLDNVEI